MAERPDGRQEGSPYALPLGKFDGVRTLPLFDLERTEALLELEEVQG